MEGEVGEEKRKRREREEQQRDQYNCSEFISPNILATTKHIIQSCVTVQVESTKLLLKWP